MRLLTFSVLKNCKHKLVCFQQSRQLSCDALQPKPIEKDRNDEHLIELAESWNIDDKPDLRATVLREMRVFPDFITEKEENNLIGELEPYLKRMRYEFDHWDNAIEGYRETERSSWSAENESVLARVRALAFTDTPDGEPLPHAHVLDLAAAGYIKPHVDAVRFCGNVIAGVSLLSSAVMQLEHVSNPKLVLRALLPRRSLYIMKGPARYDFSHGVVRAQECNWRGQPVRRTRRVAVICRSAPSPQQ